MYVKYVMYVLCVMNVVFVKVVMYGMYVMYVIHVMYVMYICILHVLHVKQLMLVVHVMHAMHVTYVMWVMYVMYCLLECSTGTGIQLNRLYTNNFSLGNERKWKKLHCLILFAIVPSNQCVAFSLVNCCAVQLKLIQHCYVLPHLFENTRGVP